ncbi:hypothetical protein [Pseudonocardia sp.]|uniref:hypothetical protein n=1 Tax=Pseudonocardia sp. TaxID=60912 RepID=UPI002639CAAC|nr:hypothetical protein [Pseudonocardia sp.]
MSATWGPPAHPPGRCPPPDPAPGGPEPGRPEPGGGPSRADLAARQSALVAALVAGGPPPAGVDPSRLAATRRALLRKRAGEAAKEWPLLAAALGDAEWARTFAELRDGHEPVGALREGWEVARAVRDRGGLDTGAARELADRERRLRYDGRGAPVPRLRTRLGRLLRPRPTPRNT